MQTASSHCSSLRDAVGQNRPDLIEQILLARQHEAGPAWADEVRTCKSLISLYSIIGSALILPQEVHHDCRVPCVTCAVKADCNNAFIL